MPVNFGLLQPVAPASAFFQGQQDVRAEQERNMLRAAQMEQMQFQRAEREAMTRGRMRQEQTANELARYIESGMPEGEQGLLRFGESGVRAAKELREMRAGELDREKKLLDFITPRLAAATEQTYPLILADIARISPQFARNLPQQFDAAQISAIARQGMAIKDQLEAGKPQVVRPGERLVSPAGKEIFAAPATPTKPTPGETEELVTRLQDPTLTPAARQRLEARLDILTKREPKEPREPAIRTTKVELADGSIGVMNLDTGEITPATVGGQTAKGKPSAFAEKTAGQRKQLAVDLDRTIIELESAAKPKGLIEQSTGSGAGRLVDIGAAFVGQATPGAIAAGKLAPIADMVLKMVPRFEGPQSDKDTKSYKEAAGQLADTSLPTKIRQAAATEIVRLMKARKGQFATQDMATEGVGAAPAGAPKRREIAPGVFVTERP